MTIIILYHKIKPVRRRGGGGRCGFRPASLCNSVKKIKESLKQNKILKPVVVC
jgi:hypothetical protein